MLLLMVEHLLILHASKYKVYKYEQTNQIDSFYLNIIKAIFLLNFYCSTVYRHYHQYKRNVTSRVPLIYNI